jgi:ribosomal protein L11 methyltransferase
MYSLSLTCTPDEVDLLSAELWEFGTAGIRELDAGQRVTMIAGFESNDAREDLLSRFAAFSPEWEMEEATDWVQWTHHAWPPRAVGARLYLAPPWSKDSTPEGRVRLIHNPGLACGTGEHPCTQLALVALEQLVTPGCRVLDVGTGSGMLAIAALLFGAGLALGADTDIEALRAARENFELNHLEPMLFGGSTTAARDGQFDVAVANISGTVLLSIFDELVRVTRVGGHLILTGFTEWELPAFLKLLPSSKVSSMNEWRCVTARL